MIAGVRLIKRRWQCRIGRHRWERIRGATPLTLGRTWWMCFHCLKERGRCA